MTMQVKTVPVPAKILVFDTETTGLFKKNEDGSPIPLEECPYITQLSYAVYNSELQSIEKRYNTYIKIPEHIEITEEITNLTGTTREKCNAGVSIIEALCVMYVDYLTCNCVVAHNIEFDTMMIRNEIMRHFDYVKIVCPELRNLLNTGFEKAMHIDRYCTMKNSINLCGIKISRTNKLGKTYTYNKWPKLEELHNHLFGFVPDGLHDAMVDVDTCLRCYMSIR